MLNTFNYFMSTGLPWSSWSDWETRSHGAGGKADSCHNVIAQTKDVFMTFEYSWVGK